MKRTILLLIGLAFIPFKNQSQTVTDYDGNVYDTVVIGNQVWFKENLRVTHYNNGVPVPNVTSDTTWGGLATGARCYYNNDSAANDSVYGALYNWYAVSSSNKICPSGWHVPSDGEWTALETFLGGSLVAGGKMKETGTLHWTSPNTGATNSSGFTGLPGGMRGLTNTFQYWHENGLFWTYSSNNASSAWSRYLWYLNEGVDRNATPKILGMSIRCIKDMVSGVGNIHSPRKIILYPNPAKNRITIEHADNQYSYLIIFDLLGEVVLQNALTNCKDEIDIGFLPPGVYVLKITGETGTMQQTLIIE